MDSAKATDKTTLLESLADAAVELAQYTSYAEATGRIGTNAAEIRHWCDEVFRLRGEIDAAAAVTADEAPTTGRA
jgi:hypothetical protein